MNFGIFLLALLGLGVVFYFARKFLKKHMDGSVSGKPGGGGGGPKPL